MFPKAVSHYQPWVFNVVIATTMIMIVSVINCKTLHATPSALVQPQMTSSPSFRHDQLLSRDQFKAAYFGAATYDDWFAECNKKEIDKAVTRTRERGISAQRTAIDKPLSSQTAYFQFFVDRDFAPCNDVPSHLLSKVWKDICVRAFPNYRCDITVYDIPSMYVLLTVYSD